jgi:Fe-S-cluster containining protein
MRSRFLHPGVDAEPTTRAELTLTFAEETFQMSAELPAEGAKPRHLLPMLREFADEIVARGERASERQGRPISCKAGCGACCRQLVPISATEAHEIRALVLDLPAARRQVVEGRFADARAKLAEAGLLDDVLDPQRFEGRPDEDVEDFQVRYFQLKIPCPFLEAESCSIHPERPLVCRQYLVTSPAEACASPSEDTIVKVPIAASAATALTRATGDPRREYGWVPLVVAPEWSERNPETGDGVSGAVLLETTLRALKATALMPSKNARRAAAKRHAKAGKQGTKK